MTQGNLLDVTPRRIKGGKFDIKLEIQKKHKIPTILNKNVQ